MTKETIKRYVISTVVTFFAGFAIAVLPLLSDLTIESIQTGALVGVIFAGVRAGIKIVLEVFVAWYSNRAK